MLNTTLRMWSLEEIVGYYLVTERLFSQSLTLERVTGLWWCCPSFTFKNFDVISVSWFIYSFNFLALAYFGLLIFLLIFLLYSRYVIGSWWYSFYWRRQRDTLQSFNQFELSVVAISMAMLWLGEGCRVFKESRVYLRRGIFRCHSGWKPRSLTFADRRCLGFHYRYVPNAQCDHNISHRKTFILLITWTWLENNYRHPGAGVNGLCIDDKRSLEELQEVTTIFTLLRIQIQFRNWS